MLFECGERDTLGGWEPVWHKPEPGESLEGRVPRPMQSFLLTLTSRLGGSRGVEAEAGCWEVRAWWA